MAQNPDCAVLQGMFPKSIPGNCCAMTGIFCDATGSYISEIDLRNVPLNGPLTSNITKLNRLVSMSFGGNGITGTIPPEIGQMSSLQNLAIWNNSLTGSIPAEIGQLSGLTQLDLDNNRLNGAIPDSIGNLSNLQFLFLYRNYLNGGVPTTIGNLKLLKTLDLGANALSGTIPTELGKLQNLQQLYLPFNFLSGSIPASLGSLPLLANLGLQWNGLTGPIPPEFGSMPSLVQLVLDGNQLSGQIPMQLLQLKQLQVLSVFQNSLNGNLPPLGALTKLQFLDVTSNFFTGALPDLSNCTALQTVHFGFNMLSGEIPSSYGSLPSLIDINLAKNQLTGTIPIQLQYANNLLSVDLSNNSLTGTIPPDFGKLGKLQSFNVSWNYLTGFTPAIPRLGSNYIVSFNCLSDANNQRIATDCQNGPPGSGNGSSIPVLPIALGVVGGVILLAGIIFGAIFFLRRRARDEEEIKSMAVAAGTTNLFRGNSVQFSVHSVDDSLRSSASLRSNTRSDARLYPNSPLHSAASPVMPTYHPNNAAGVSPASFGPASSSSFGSSTATSPLAAYAKMQHQSLQTGGGGPGGSQLFAAYTPGRVQPQQQQYLRDAGIVPGGDYARRVVTASGAPAQRIAGWQQQSPSRAMSLKADTKALGGEKFFGFVPPPAASVSEQDIKSKLRMGGGGSGGGGGAQPMWHSGPSPSPSPGGEPARVVDVRFVHERGPVATWSHMTVMDWALARRVGDAVLTVFANNGFDGPTLVALRAESVGSGIGSQMADALRATFGVVDFDTRRRIVGAVAGLAMAESAVAEAATADAASAAAAAAAAPPMYRPSDS